MGVKKRSKVNAEFNMSSMTDIIFLLLIFFMLTSNLVAPNALNLKLPGSQKSTTTVSKDPTDVTIKRDGTLYFNGQKSKLKTIESKLRRLKRSDRNLSMTITPDDKAPVEAVVSIMDIAMRYEITSIMITDE